MAEHAGLEVRIVAGSEHNYKITTMEDMHEAAALLTARYETKVGMGFDAHKIAPEQGDLHVTLCGVRVESGFALAGHSDADVGLHALVDAMLGGISAGDIGLHFPPSDPQWKGADSAQFVTHALKLLKERGGLILHADVTLICERPHISPHRDKMVARIAELLETEKAPRQAPESHDDREKWAFYTRGGGGRRRRAAARASRGHAQTARRDWMRSLPCIHWLRFFFLSPRERKISLPRTCCGVKKSGAGSPSLGPLPKGEGFAPCLHRISACG